MRRGCLQRAYERLDQQLSAKSGIRAAWDVVLKAAVLRHGARVRRYLSTLLRRSSFLVCPHPCRNFTFLAAQLYKTMKQQHNALIFRAKKDKVIRLYIELLI